MMHSREASQPEAVVDPWVTCFLTGMVIRHLDSLPGIGNRIDYHRIMGVVEGFDHIQDSKAFLLDPNNWVPHVVLRELIHRSEEASGCKDVTYRAALAYFASSDRREPTLIETIARYLDDVDTAVRSSGLWASAYSNYLRMQAFARPDETHTLYVLVRFLPPVDPQIGNCLLVKGNIEGFSQLYPFVESASCEEQYSQLRLATVVAEFGKEYVLKPEGPRNAPTAWLVQEGKTGRTVATALPFWMEVEPAAGWDEGQAYAADRPASRASGHLRALRIQQPGVLRAGSLEYVMHEGTIYDAPYTRYRFQWRERSAPEAVRRQADSETERDTKGVISRLLFDHLVGLQATQRRALGIIIRNRELREENKYLKEELYGTTETGGLVGKSRPMEELFSLVHSVAQSDVTVLITGETGTGKEQTARLIHHLSPRRTRRFLAINCGALAENLLESELFGHERGAFTGSVMQKKGKFEQATGGTLFLDEIGEVSPAMQVKLLRVLQEREFQRVGGHEDIKVDVRIIAATNQDLQELVTERRFRQDLFYRLNVFPLRSPPLRERVEDIPLIAQHLLDRHATAQKKAVQGLTGEALEALVRYRWPGNVRELENVIERAIALAGPKTAMIGPDLLPPSIREAPETISARGLDDLVDRVEWPLIVQALKNGHGLTGLIKRIERALIRRAIKEHAGNKTAAARLLGRTYRWLRKAETERPGD
jgi:transcriptional regulator with GAF, ATPase, and Fis domain